MRETNSKIKTIFFECNEPMNVTAKRFDLIPIDEKISNCIMK